MVRTNPKWLLLIGLVAGVAYADRANCNPNTTCAVITCSNSVCDDGCGPTTWGTADCTDAIPLNPTPCNPNNCDATTCSGYVCDDGCGATENGISNSPNCIVPSATNQPPTVNLPPDFPITFPATANIAASVSDDGLPNPPSQLVLTWSEKVGSSDPGTVMFSNPTSTLSSPVNTTVATTASFSQPGNYVICLTAWDSAAGAQDCVQVTVNPPAGNQPPSVDAGAPQTIMLGDTATMAGKVQDDGLPKGAPLTIGWSQISGPGVAAFADATNPTTTVTFTQAGTYDLRLTASDTEFSPYSDVTIIVQNPGTICNGHMAICGHINTGETGVAVEPLANIPVQLRASDTGKVTQTQLTGNDGAYEFSNGLHAGDSYFVTPVLDRLQTASPDRLLAVVPAGNNDFRILGVPATITVKDAPGTSVFISVAPDRPFHAGEHPPSVDPKVPYSATIGSNGEVVLKVEGGRSYFLTCWKKQSNGQFGTNGSVSLNGSNPLNPNQAIGSDGSLNCGGSQ